MGAQPGRRRVSAAARLPAGRHLGHAGSQRRAGDGQVPEGFYHVNRFHPRSAYHLSLGLDYPSPHDILATGLADPGGDIFLHGSNVSEGCLPLTNAGIEEVYLLAVAARASQHRGAHLPLSAGGERVEQTCEQPAPGILAHAGAGLRVF